MRPLETISGVLLLLLFRDITYRQQIYHERPQFGVFPMQTFGPLASLARGNNATKAIAAPCYKRFSQSVPYQGTHSPDTATQHRQIQLLFKEKRFKSNQKEKIDAHRHKYKATHSPWQFPAHANASSPLRDNTSHLSLSRRSRQ